jgi:hypothetical protein
MIVHDFLEFGRYITAKDHSTVMILRTVGPDGVTDTQKANEIYSAYHLNLEPLGEGLFDKLLYNEFVFIQFNSEQEAYDFALENLPMNKKNIDSDYFVQFYIFSDGEFAYGNNSVKGLTELPYLSNP